MRIFVIHNQYQQRGGEDVVVEQEIDLLKRENEVQLFTTKNYKGIKGAIQTLLSPWNIFITRRIIKEIKNFNPDIIHVHNLHYSIGPLIIRKIKKLGIPIVMTLHNYRLICPSATLSNQDGIYTKSIRENFPWSAVFDRVHNNSYIKTFWLALTYWLHKNRGTWNSVDRYIVMSEFAKKIIADSTLNISNKIVVKPNTTFIPDEDIDYQPRQHFLYIGRLSAEKGIEVLLEAFSETSFALKIAGDGPLKNLVLDYAGKHPNIEYLGLIPFSDLDKEIRTSSALIVPSVCYETFGLTIIEAFARHSSPIVSDIDTFKEIVRDDFNGLCFKTGDKDDLIQQLKKWSKLTDEQKSKIRNQGQKDFIEKYTHESGLKNLTEIYQKLVRKL